MLSTPPATKTSPSPALIARAAALTAARPSGRTSFNAPRWRPIGVRTASTITASGIGLDLRGMVLSIASGHLDFGIRSAARSIGGVVSPTPPEGLWDPGTYLYLEVRWRRGHPRARGRTTNLYPP